MLLISLGTHLQAEASAEISLQEILERTRLQQSKISEDIEDAIFSARLVYKELKKNGEMKKELISQRRVYMKRGEKRSEEYLSMIRNGKKLSDKELKEEIQNIEKMSKHQRETKMPFIEEGAYDYQLLESFEDIWIVSFQPKKETDGYIKGKGYILKDSFNIVRVEFVPANMPWVINDMKMSLTYSRIQEYWMPAKFEMDMKIRVGLIADVFYKQITIEDTYSEYKFNSVEK